MALSMFRITKGLELDNIQILEGAGVPGAAGDPSLAPVGSLYLDHSSGDLYTKITAGVGTNKWSKQAASSYVDSQITNLQTEITNLGNAFNYVGVLTAGVAQVTPFDLATLPTNGKDAGDYYKASTSGWFVVGAGTAFYANAGDGLVWNTSGGVDIIDNTNSNVQGTANLIAVSGSSDVGYVITIDPAFVGRMTTVEGDITTINGSITTINGQISTLQGQSNNVQTEVDAIETSVGGLVNANGTFNAAGATFNNVTSPTSITNVLTQLDSAIGAGVTTNTIITAGSSVDSNIQALADYVEQSGKKVVGTGTQSITDTVTAVVAKWIVYATQTGTPANMSSFEVLGATNGADVDYNEYGILRLGVGVAGIAAAVTVSGGDLVLTVTSTTNMEVKIKRVSAV
jgi:hypothetical protein